MSEYLHPRFESGNLEFEERPKYRRQLARGRNEIGAERYTPENSYMELSQPERIEIIVEVS